MTQGYLSLQEVADALGVHPRTVIRWIETSKVDVPKKKNRQGHYCFSKDDLAKFRAYAEGINEVSR